MSGIEIPEPPEIPETEGAEYNQALREWCSELQGFKAYWGTLSPAQTGEFLCKNVYGDAAQHAEGYILREEGENAHRIHNLPDDEIAKLPPTHIPTTDDPHRLLEDASPQNLEAVQEYVQDNVGDYKTSMVESVIEGIKEKIGEFLGTEPEQPQSVAEVSAPTIPGA